LAKRKISKKVKLQIQKPQSLDMFFIDSDEIGDSIPKWDKAEYDTPWDEVKDQWKKWCKRYNDRTLDVRKIIRVSDKFERRFRVEFVKKLSDMFTTPDLTKKEIKAIKRILGRVYESIELKSQDKNKISYFVVRKEQTK